MGFTVNKIVTWNVCDNFVYIIIILIQSRLKALNKYT